MSVIESSARSLGKKSREVWESSFLG